MAEKAPKESKAPSAVSVDASTDVSKLSAKEQGWILRAAARIHEAEKAAKEKAEHEKLKAQQYEQSSEGRAARLEKAGAK